MALGNPDSRNPRLWLLCCGFVICGMVTVLPGPLLPLMAARWHLRDVQSGGFLAAEFAASTVGSIFSPYRLSRNLPTGYALMTAGALLLMISGHTAAWGHMLALAGFVLIGLGIGLGVTATNLHVASRAEGRARRLSVVNLFWGAGAVACPWLVAVAERADRVGSLVGAIALGAGLMFLGLLPLLRPAATAASAVGPVSRRAEIRVLGFFATFLFLYVGVETVVAGWITTYAHRFSGMTLERASLMVSLFWLALLAGRAIGSVALKSVRERKVLLPALVVGLAAVAVLVAPSSPLVMMAAVILAGMGFGPVFPVGVSRMLARVTDIRNMGWVFAFCASGGAVLPWLTGLLSTRYGSLRVGFAVPVAALAAVLALALLENVALRESRSVEATSVTRAG